MPLMILVAALLVFPVAAFAQKDGPVPSIAVNGQAEVMVVPDQVVFTLTVENLKLDLSAARQETEADVKKVFALAQSYKIPPQNVQTYYIRVSERYEKEESNKPALFKGYQVSQTIVIMLPDISRFENMFSELLTAGVSDVSNVDFRLSKPRQYMDQARTLALKAAREKAIAMAGDLGQKVGNPLSITEVGTDISSAYESNSNSNYSNNISSSVGDGVPDNKTSVAPGMMSVTARVKVIFAIN